MDGTTEPIIAVIGHPIAGNPSQFAIERALESLDLDWRVLSFDVQPENISAALEGFKVTGIAGVMIDVSVMNVASDWYATKCAARADDDESIVEPLDCLFRDKDLRLQGVCEQQLWFDELLATNGSRPKLLIGHCGDSFLRCARGFDESERLVSPTAEQIAAAHLIVLGRGADGSARLDGIDWTSEDWPADDGSTVVVDLGDGMGTDHLDQLMIGRLGYSLVTPHDRQVATLVRCIVRWTGHEPSLDVVSDAVEEYLGV